jgi:glycosyltransferase involved in cell wall biosynthesis
MRTPSVSVIIPTCNRPKLLSTAIRSVLDQTFTNFELFVVDDASDASVADVVNSFPDKRVRWIRHEKRRGGAAARNTGIRNTVGELVGFLDDDDEWVPEKLARQVPVLVENPEIGAVYTGYEIVDRATGKTHSEVLPLYRGDLSSVLLRGNSVGPTSSILLRRKCFEKVGMFDESLPAFQDYDLWIRLSRVYKFDYVHQSLFKYHVHSNKIWTNPAAIHTGLNILVKRYGASKSFRKLCAVYYLRAAIQFCEAGESKRARTALRRGISLQPFNAKYYLYFLLSLLDRRTYQNLQQSKARIIGSLMGVQRDVS